ncbi:putative leucine rich repeat containing 34 [Operophtera brumata]|uniref:Putative leucine rich repeat containing 34 n=1 Tax=Operophtera brumata TaxID=104452 RepID=A0A0L7KUQ7_OPEBR|nr:putative leucine rich repeat containing 34 [Operophtera brumata]
MVLKSIKKNKKKCICDTEAILGKITGTPEPLQNTQVNKIRLSLFTERNSDGSGWLVLRGNDIFDRYKRRIQDLDIRAICLYTRELPRRITKLDLSYNLITDVGFRKLLKMLLVKGRSSLINLNIMNNDLTEDSILGIAKYSKYIKLKYLRLNGNDFGTKGGEYFAKFLINNNSVEYCDIGQTSQTLTSVAQIVTALRIDHGANQTMKVFDFSRIIPLFNRYSYETKWLAYHIEYLLERNSTIIELHLQKNEFIGHDMDYFARGLRRNTTLLYLDLGYNKIGDYGAELLGKYLSEGPQLVLLNVAGNSIKDTGARALSFGLPYSKVRALDISNNKITDRGILDLLNTIKKSIFMRFLNIWGNKFGDVTCRVIERMLQSGVLFQHTIDVKLYEIDEVLYAAYYPNPADRNKHLYYCEMNFGIPLCKALGLKVTATVFTAGASQAVAKKAGFEDLYEITYEELAQKGFIFPGIEKDTKTSKLMALIIE